MDDLTDKRVDRDHALGLQLAERNVNRPSIRAGIMEAIIGKINTFPDAHSGVAHQQQDIGGQIIAAEQFLLNQLILLGRQGAWQPLRSARNVLATDQMGQVGDLRAPGKLFQHAAHKQQACDVDRGRQVLGAQIDKPAENVGIAAQLIERVNGGMLLTKIDQKAAGDGTILTGGGRRRGLPSGSQSLSGTAAPTDVPAERNGRVSRCPAWYGPNVLRHSFRILLIDLKRGDFDIDHRRFNPRVAHQLHQGR